MKTLHMTENRLRSLQALGFFQCLTLEQFLTLGITTDKSNLTKRVLHPLRDASPALVECKKRSATDEDIYCLKGKGAELLAEHLGISPEKVVWPKDGIQFTIDARHRRLTIDFLIALKRWSGSVGAQIDFVAPYYQKRGAQKGKGKKPCFAVTRHWIGKEVFEPDLELRLQMGSESRLFAFELHAGRDAGKIVDQLMGHTRAIKAGTLSKHYDHPFANYVLSVYDHLPTMRGVEARLGATEKFSPYRSHFLFNTLETLLAQFSTGWHLVDGAPVGLFSDASHNNS